LGFIGGLTFFPKSLGPIFPKRPQGFSLWFKNPPRVGSLVGVSPNLGIFVSRESHTFLEPRGAPHLGAFSKVLEKLTQGAGKTQKNWLGVKVNTSFLGEFFPKTEEGVNLLLSQGFWYSQRAIVLVPNSWGEFPSKGHWGRIFPLWETRFTWTQGGIYLFGSSPQLSGG